MEKSILACINGIQSSQAVCDYAAWFAQGSKQNLKLLHALDHHSTEPQADLSGSIGLGARSELLKEFIQVEHEQNKILNHKAKLLLKAAKDRVVSLGVADPKVCLRNGYLIENLTELQDQFSLAILGRQRETLGYKVEAVIRSLQKPLMVISQPFTEPKSVLLAFDNSKLAHKALNFVQQQEVFKNLEIHLVYAGENNPASNQFLEQAKQQLKDFQVQSILLEGPPQEALLQYLQQKNLSLTVMGAFGHNWIHDFMMGSFTTKMLAKSQKPLLLVR